jgi:hypothetical protein
MFKTAYKTMGLQMKISQPARIELRQHELSSNGYELRNFWLGNAKKPLGWRRNSKWPTLRLISGEMRPQTVMM